MLICIYNLIKTDNETFSLWDGSDFIFATYTKQNWFVYYIRSIVFIGFNVLAIEILVKSHIDTSLVKIAIMALVELRNNQW